MSSRFGPQVVLLAHERLSDLVEALERKARSTTFSTNPGPRPTVVNPAERRVLALATAARDMLRGGPPIDLVPGPNLRPGLSRFAVLGTTGFDLAGSTQGLTAVPWHQSMVRTGSPDPDLAPVLARTTEFALRVGTEGLSRSGTDNGPRDRIRAYTLGMLCALAGDVVIGPVLRGLQAERTTRDPGLGEPTADADGSRDRLLALLLGAGANTRWTSWTPAAAEVPAALYEGYAAAYVAVFGDDAARPRGFAAFEQALLPADAVTAARLRTAQEMLLTESALADWSWPVWWAILSPALLAAPVSLLLARTLPHAGAFTSAGGDADERAVVELLSLTAGVSSIAPFAWSMYLWSQVPQHADTFVNALVLGVLRAALTPTLLIESGAGAPAVARWLLLTAQLGTDGYAIVRGIAALSQGRAGDAMVFFVQALPLATSLLVLLVAEVLHGLGADDDAGYWIAFIVLSAGLLIGAGIPLAVALSHSGGLRGLFRALPVSDAVHASGDQRGPVALARLFDDSTLWTPVQPAAAASLRFPAGNRALVKIWWTGAGSLTATADHHAVTLTRDGAAPVTVSVRPGGVTAAELVTLLSAAVPGLQVAEIATGDPEYLLPWPETFADPGDSQPTLAGHDAHEADAVPVGTDADHALVLRHAPRSQQTLTFGIAGPSGSPFDGIALAPQTSLGELQESAVGTAADLAVLMCLGAAPHLMDAAAPITVATVPGRPPVTDPGLDPVHQVFRQWNLDERRVNEWRMLVAGAAVSEKAGAPASADPGMLTAPAGYLSPSPTGEPTANALGWVPLWRAWQRMATDVTTDSSLDQPMPYTPSVPMPDATRAPTNSELTDAVRFLLDLR